MEPPRDVIVITGPTASGKTSLGIELANTLNGEILNADSVALYEDFDIGSGKPTKDQQQKVVHQLLSIVSPEEDFDAGHFVRLATAQIENCFSQGVLPIVVGGTGLYLRALLCGLVQVEEITEQVRNLVRVKEEEFRRTVSSDAGVSQLMYQWLAEKDPVAVSRIHENDLVRIRRALLVGLSSGTSLADLQDRHQNADYPFRALVIVLLPEREELYAAIDERVDHMLSAGLIREVQKLRDRYSSNSRPFQAIGYRHVGEYLDGNWDYSTMVERLKQDTRRYAKRQLTWWRNQPGKVGWTDATAEWIVTRQAVGSNSFLARLRGVVEAFTEKKGDFLEGKVFFIRLEGEKEN